KTLVDFVAADAAEIKALVVVEHILNKRAGIVYGSEVAWAKSAVYLNKCFVSTMGWIFFERNANVAVLALVNMLEGVLDLVLGHAKCFKQRCNGNLTL